MNANLFAMITLSLPFSLFFSIAYSISANYIVGITSLKTNVHCQMYSVISAEIHHHVLFDMYRQQRCLLFPLLHGDDTTNRLISNHLNVRQHWLRPTLSAFLHRRGVSNLSLLVLFFRPELLRGMSWQNYLADISYWQ